MYGSAGSTTPLYQQQTGTANATVWYHSDGLGSVRALSDGSTGALLNTYGYSGYGSTSVQSGSITNTHQFGGEQLDPTGLYYNRGRYYNPSTSRFLSRDTFGGSAYNPVSQNRFAYGGDNPTRYTDPSGYRYLEPDAPGNSSQDVAAGPGGVKDRGGCDPQNHSDTAFQDCTTHPSLLSPEYLIQVQTSPATNTQTSLSFNLNSQNDFNRGYSYRRRSNS